MLENLKLSIDNKDFAGRVLMDLSKAFHTINQPLFLAKLHDYGFRKQALALLCCCLSSRKQRINKDQCFQFLKGFNIRCASRIRPSLFITLT